MTWQSTYSAPECPWRLGLEAIMEVGRGGSRASLCEGMIRCDRDTQAQQIQETLSQLHSLHSKSFQASVLMTEALITLRDLGYEAPLLLLYVRSHMFGSMVLLYRVLYCLGGCILSVFWT